MAEEPRERHPTDAKAAKNAVMGTLRISVRREIIQAA
jgi:hypothetical protein